MEEPPGNKPLLTEKQKNLIRFTWNRLEPNMAEVGSMVFGRIFNRNPDVKALFPFKGVYGEALQNHPVFTNHAYRSVIYNIFWILAKGLEPFVKAIVYRKPGTVLFCAHFTYQMAIK